MDMIQPYVKSEQIFVCPSAKKDESNSGRFTNYRYPSPATLQYGSYGINAAYPEFSPAIAAGSFLQANQPAPRALSELESAATTVWVGDW